MYTFYHYVSNKVSLSIGLKSRSCVKTYRSLYFVKLGNTSELSNDLFVGEWPLDISPLDTMQHKMLECGSLP